MASTHDHPVWHVGDHVWLRMSDNVYPAEIASVCDYTETHADGYECQQYEATVTFPLETVLDVLISHCMILGRREEEQHA